jgi:hypothetical protein
MGKLIRLGVLCLGVWIASPRPAAADMTNRELRQTIAAADYFLNEEFPLAAAVACDEQRGASGTWEADSTCNVHIERIAAMISLMSGGTVVIADAVTAWCSAAEIVHEAKTVLAQLNGPPDRSPEARNRRAWEGMWGYQQGMFIALNTTIGFLYYNFPDFEE